MTSSFLERAIKIAQTPHERALLSDALRSTAIGIHFCLWILAGGVGEIRTTFAELAAMFCVSENVLRKKIAANGDLFSVASGRERGEITINVYNPSPGYEPPKKIKPTPLLDLLEKEESQKETFITPSYCQNDGEINRESESEKEKNDFPPIYINQEKNINKLQENQESQTSKRYHAGNKLFGEILGVIESGSDQAEIKAQRKLWRRLVIETRYGKFRFAGRDNNPARWWELAQDADNPLAYLNRCVMTGFQECYGGKGPAADRIRLLDRLAPTVADWPLAITPTEPTSTAAEEKPEIISKKKTTPTTPAKSESKRWNDFSDISTDELLREIDGFEVEKILAETRELTARRFVRLGCDPIESKFKGWRLREICSELKKRETAFV